MSPRSATSGRAGLLACALSLAACGQRAPEAPAGGAAALGAPAAAAAAAPRFAPDTGPWSESPEGEAWELAGWLPRAGHVTGYLVDPALLRAHRASFRTSSLWFEVVEARRRWVRELGLPEGALGDVIAVTEPVRFAACQPKPPGPAILEGLRSRGWRSEDVGGALTFVAPDGEAPGVAWIDGRLVLGPYDAALYERLAALRAGRERSARDLPAVRAGCSAVGAGGFAEIDAYERPQLKGPPGAPPMLASVGRYRLEAEPVTDVRALVLASEGDRDALRASLEQVLVGVPPPAGPPMTLGTHGAVVRLVVPASLAHSAGALESGVRNDLGALSRALERYAADRGGLPTEAEGLAALARMPECLDEVLGAVPLDPWGHPYAYQPQHPKRPGSYVLRSLGPDGEIDTEDDVLPE